MAWTTPRTWVDGETETASIFNTHVRDNFKAIGDPWTAYTPAWTSTGTAPALGNGTSVGAYMAAGKQIHFRFVITFGSTSTFGTGFYRFSLPVAAAHAVGSVILSTAIINDTGTASWPGFGCSIVTSTTIDIRIPTASGDARLDAVQTTKPMTFANTDVISVAGTYEAA